MTGIVVGVTDSEHSRHVLEWAMREAAHHHAPLEVVTVRPEQPRPATGIFWGAPRYPEDPSNAELARMGVHEFVDKVAHEIDVSVPEVTVVVTTGDPAEELAGASRDADLLVVGASATGLSRLISGSISEHVTHRAGCPVVVIPD